MDTFVKIIVAFFFLLGAIDYFLDDKFGIGIKFKNGMSTMSGLALGMVGIYSLSPIIGQALSVIFTPISTLTGIDISVFSCMFLAIDMGGYKIASTVSRTPEIANYSGILISSTFGTVISFSLPIAVSLLNKNDINTYIKGFVIALISIPFGCMIGGIVVGIPINTLIISSIPMFVVAFFLVMLNKYNENLLIKSFLLFRKLIMFIGIIGLVNAGISSITGYEFIKNALPIEESFTIVVKMAIFLAGIYPAIHLLQSILQRHLHKISSTLGLSDLSIICIIGNLVTSILVYDMFNELDEKGKLLLATLSVTSAYVIGGQLAYVSASEPKMVFAFFVTKFAGGIIGTIIVLFTYKKNKIK